MRSSDENTPIAHKANSYQTPESEINHAKIRIKAKRLASLLKHGKLDVYLLEGNYHDRPMRVLLADDGSTLKYIRRLIFKDKVKMSFVGLISPFAGTNLCSINFDVDLVIVGVNVLLMDSYMSKGFHLVPKWIQLFVPIWDHPDAMYNSPELDRETRKYFRRLKRTIESQRYTFGVSVDPEWFNFFYYRMYLPYARKRHNNLAIVHSYKIVYHNFSRGIGIMVSKDDLPLGGGIAFREGKIMNFRHMGMIDGNIEASREGASAALDYHVMQISHSLDCTQMNFGHTRAFTSDGVLKYKLMWQARVEDDDDAISVFAIASPGNTPQAQKFKSEHRFYQLIPGGIELYNGQ